MKRVLSVLLALCLILAAPICAVAAGPVLSEKPMLNSQDYGGNAYRPIISYLYANENGGVTRVELYSEKYGQAGYNPDYNDKILIEEYDKDLGLLSSKFIDKPLPKWGHFFAGEKYNFIITGQDNQEKSDNVEVLRVSKYSKDWTHIDDCNIRGLNTKDVFEFCSMRATEANGALFIRTGHGMYNDHQSNLTIQISEETMEYIASNHEVTNYSTGYVSHSFNQFIMTDEEDNLIAVDHGDAYPRGIILFKYPYKAGLTPFYTDWMKVPSTMVTEFPGETGDNYTGCMVGSLEETRNKYLVSYSCKEGREPGIFLASVDKDTLAAKSVKISGLDRYTAPIVAPTSLDGGYIMWALDTYSGALHDDGARKIRYASYDADGNIGEIKTDYGRLSDCKPIMWNGKLLWYVVDGVGSNYSLRFYTLDENGIESRLPSAPGYIPPDNYFPKSDENFRFVEDILVEYRGTSRNVVIPKGTRVIADSTFVNNHDIDSIVIPADTYPDDETGENRYSIGYKAFTPFTKPVDLYVDLYFFWGEVFSVYDNHENVRLHIGIPDEPPVGGFTDIKSSDYFADAVTWAVENGITSGVGDNKFGPGQKCTRGQIVTFLWNAAGKPEPESTANPFTDISSGDYYYKAVLWAVENDITSGLTATSFGPKSTCTRAQAMTFIWNASGKPEPQSTASPFGDVKSGEYYYRAVLWAAENGVTSGKTANSFGTGDPCTRGQIVTFLYNAKEL